MSETIAIRIGEMIPIVKGSRVPRHSHAGGPMIRRFLAMLPFLTVACMAQVVIINTRWPVPVPRLPPVHADCRIRSVEVHADVQDQAARVTISQVFQNPSPVPM